MGNGNARSSMAQHACFRIFAHFSKRGDLWGQTSAGNRQQLWMFALSVRVGFHCIVIRRQRGFQYLSWDRDGAASQSAAVIEPLRGPCSRLRVCCASLECCSYSCQPSWTAFACPCLRSIVFDGRRRVSNRWHVVLVMHVP